MTLRLFALSALTLACGAFAGDLTDIKHVVLFMQENRAFDHYFGTMSGVRGFSDPNVQINPDGRNTFQQIVYPDMSTEATSLNPWYLNYLGGNWTVSMQCSGAGSNGWDQNHIALNHDLNNLWAANNTWMSWGYFKRSDVPLQFALAEGWTVADAYQEGAIASTLPNRVVWMSGSINCPGGPQTPDQGGTIIDNSGTFGCEFGPNVGCYPFSWKTFPEFLEDYGVSWQVWQDVDNFGDDILSSFVQFMDAPADSNLTIKGNSYPGLEAFYERAQNGTLPLVSWIVGPAELSEHNPNTPHDGAWLQRQIVEAVTTGAAYNNTALLISYDEAGGWGDHVVPFHSPSGTAGEWMADPYNGEQVYTGPGFRVPFYIISPWTRGGRVYTEHVDHNSQIMFVEQWLQAIGYKGLMTDQIPAWRRAHMADLVNMFDFDHPDYSLPELPEVTAPMTDEDGNYDFVAWCNANFGDPKPPAPYGKDNQNMDMASVVEDGFKQVIGYLTEGRFLVLEMNNYALTNPQIFPLSNSPGVTATPATKPHSVNTQRWVIHAVGGTALDGGQGAGLFTISSGVDGTYLGTFTNGASHFVLGSDTAETWTIHYLGNGAGYTVQASNGQYLTISSDGRIMSSSTAAAFQIFSVTYQF